MADAGGVADPNDETLEAYYRENAANYREPARLSFSHVYFNADRRGGKAEQDAENLLAKLRTARPPVTQAPDKGDPFMLPRVYVNRGTDEIARDFGPAFAQQIEELEAGQWQGPITSAYGVHLVYIDAREEPQLPPLEQVRSRVANDWHTQQRHAADARIYERLRSGYEIVIPGELTQRR